MNRRKKRKLRSPYSSKFKNTLRYCLNCGEDLKGKAGHFVPPSLGDKGFYICTKKESDAETTDL